MCIWQSAGQALEELTRRISVLEWTVDSDDRDHQQRMDIVKHRLQQPMKALTWWCSSLLNANTKGSDTLMWIFLYLAQVYKFKHKLVSCLFLQLFAQFPQHSTTWQKVRPLWLLQIFCLSLRILKLNFTYTRKVSLKIGVMSTYYCWILFGIFIWQNYVISNIRTVRF